LAGNVDRCGELRATLRERVLRSPLGNVGAFMRDYEHTLLMMRSLACDVGHEEEL
jgi:hypothetical protein